MTQLFAEHLSAGSGVFLLLVMAYDRYVAICKPLHYLVIMRQRVCLVLLVVSWVGGFLHSVIKLSTVYGLPFCGPSIIDYYMCDMYPLLKLISTDTYVSYLLVAFSGGLICTLGFLLLLWCHPALPEEPESVRKGDGKPSRPVVPTSLWLSASLFPAFSCM